MADPVYGVPAGPKDMAYAKTLRDSADQYETLGDTAGAQRLREIANSIEHTMPPRGQYPKGYFEFSPPTPTSLPAPSPTPAAAPPSPTPAADPAPAPPKTNGQSLPSPGDLHWGDWERTPQNQQAQKPFEPYRAILPARPSSQWGQPDFILDGARKMPGLAPGPFMPQSRDVPNVLQSLFGGLGKTGSPQVRSLILAAAAGHSGWLNSYLKGWEMRQKILHQQTTDNLEQAELRQQQESERYGVAFGTYKGDRLKQELYKIAYSLPGGADAPMLEFLNNGDIAGAENLQKQRDAHYLTLSKMNEQNRKNRKEQREEEADERTRKIFEGGTPAAPGTGASATPAPTPPAAAAPVASTLAAPGPEPEARAPQLTPGEDLARRIFRDEPVQTAQLPPDIVGGAQARAAQLSAQLDAINNSGKTGDDLLKDVRKLDATTGNLLDDLAHYRTPASQQKSAYNDRLESLAGRVVPGWNKGGYEWRTQFSNPNGQTQQLMARANGLVEAQRVVLESIKTLDPNATPPANVLNQIATNGFTSDPTWRGVANAWRHYVTESAAVSQGGGRPTVFLQREINDAAPFIGGPKTIRLALQQDARMAWTFVQHRKDEWDSMIRDGSRPVGWSDAGAKDMDTMRHIDPDTGKFPGVRDVPPELLATIPPERPTGTGRRGRAPLFGTDSEIRVKP